jgi:hypothetical protein
MRAAVAVFLLIGAAGCAGTGTPPTLGAAPLSSEARKAPGKCSACHLAPREHSLAAERWPAYLKAHKRRLHLSDEEQAFLYDFLVGGELSTAKAP